MLQSLKDRETATVRRALVAAGTEVLRDSLSAEGLAGDVLSEVAEKTRKSADPERRIAEITGILSRAISDEVLPEDQRDVVRKRLGNKGKLSKALYRIEFGQKFRANIDFSGVRETHASNAILHGEGSQHFVSLTEGGSAQPFRSLFTQNVGKFTVLINAIRNGDLLLVEDGYRVYHDEVDVAAAETPLDVLKSFLNVFGDDVTIEVDDKLVAGPAKLIHEFITPFPKGSRLKVTQAGAQVALIGRSQNDEVLDDRAEITLDFAVNIRRYQEYLMRHGLKSAAPGMPNSGYFRGIGKP